LYPGGLVTPLLNQIETIDLLQTSDPFHQVVKCLPVSDIHFGNFPIKGRKFLQGFFVVEVFCLNSKRRTLFTNSEMILHFIGKAISSIWEIFNHGYTEYEGVGLR
jgi:hypothetical protein